MSITDFFHPPLELATLRALEVVRQLMIEHPAYFLDCPYNGETERLLKGWFDPKSVKARQAKVDADHEEASNTATLEDDKWQYLYQETVTLYKSLKLAKFSSSDDDQMSYFRTATSLMEKLIALQERSLGLKQISEHNALVLQIMESVLSPTQRNEVMAQLEAALKS